MYLPAGSIPLHPLHHLRSLYVDNPLYYHTPVRDQLSLLVAQDLSAVIWIHLIRSSQTDLVRGYPCFKISAAEVLPLSSKDKPGLKEKWSQIHKVHALLSSSMNLEYLITKTQTNTP